MVGGFGEGILHEMPEILYVPFFSLETNTLLRISINARETKASPISFPFLDPLFCGMAFLSLPGLPQAKRCVDKPGKSDRSGLAGIYYQLPADTAAAIPQALLDFWNFLPGADNHQQRDENVYTGPPVE